VLGLCYPPVYEPAEVVSVNRRPGFDQGALTIEVAVLHTVAQLGSQPRLYPADCRVANHHFSVAPESAHLFVPLVTGACPVSDHRAELVMTGSEANAQPSGLSIPFSLAFQSTSATWLPMLPAGKCSSPTKACQVCKLTTPVTGRLANI
jgi:hypothetical protein